MSRLWSSVRPWLWWDSARQWHDHAKTCPFCLALVAIVLLHGLALLVIVAAWFIQDRT